MALGVLLILFIFLVVASGLGIVFLLLAKNKTVKKVMFYILCVLSLIIAYISAGSLPSNYILQRVFALVVGALSIVAIFIHLKNDKKNVAYTLVIASIVIGILKLFCFI